MKRIRNPEVAAVLRSYPKAQRDKMLEIRALLFATARETEGVGALEETLKWGEPAYLTSETGSGSTIRIAWKEKAPDRCAGRSGYSRARPRTRSLAPTLPWALARPWGRTI